MLVGQTVSVSFRITPDLVYAESVAVVGDTRLVDTRKSEVTTNVTQEQLRYLPQNTRNFLNFAALAPGVRVSDNEFRKEFSAGALPSQNVNVFIDGVSYKNDVIDGGVVGQDASRGSPFPQNAVQEFQVLTQNFKAEYEKAASAIITAITRSGGNRYTGELFNFYQDKGLVENEAMVRDAQNLLVKGKTEPKPTYERFQWGASLGGPIVKDRMQFFGSYEENRQDRAANVLVGTVSTAPASLVSRLREYEGVFTSPFREKLLFGKVSLQPKPAHQVEVTYNWRNETDIRGFGGRDSFVTAENVENRVDSLQGKWQTAQATFLNEAYVSYQRYRWNPRPENPGIIGENFEGLLRIGGRDTEQFIVQQRVSIRDDFSKSLKWHGGAHGQGRRHRERARLRRPQALQRQPALHVSWRHQLGFSRAREFWRRRSEPERQELSGRRLRAGRLGGHAAAHPQPGAAMGLRVGHAEQRLCDPGQRARGGRPVRRCLALLHRRRRPAGVLRRLAASARLLLRRDGQRADHRLWRVGTLLRSRALQLDARRAFPPAGTPSARSSSRRAAGFATASRRSCGIRRT